MTVEHYYQSKKFEGAPLEEEIRLAFSPKEAKQLAWAQPVTVDNWDALKEKVMIVAVRAKFAQNPELRKKLIDTGDKKIHEDSPSDMYWGINGADKLGKIIMQVRNELRNDNTKEEVK